MHANLLDAQTALTFLQSQLTHIETEVYGIVYPDVRYPRIVPVDTSANEWIPSVTYYSFDVAGQASWFNGRAQDVPNASVQRSKFETPVRMGAIGYEFTTEEINQARLVGRNLTTEKGDAARLAAEQFIDKVAITGDASVGFAGLINNSAVTAGSAAATGTGSATTFASKTPGNILADVNGVLTGMWTGSLGAELADTLLMPMTQFSDINTRQMSATESLTVLEWIRRNNIYTATTGRPLTIIPIIGLETAGSGGTARMVAYLRDPRVVKMHIPMPFRFSNQPWQVGPFTWHVPGAFRIGGVDIRRPSAFRYLDGI